MQEKTLKTSIPLEHQESTLRLPNRQTLRLLEFISPTNARSKGGWDVAAIDRSVFTWMVEDAESDRGFLPTRLDRDLSPEKGLPILKSSLTLSHAW